MSTEYGTDNANKKDHQLCKGLQGKRRSASDTSPPHRVRCLSSKVRKRGTALPRRRGEGGLRTRGRLELSAAPSGVSATAATRVSTSERAEGGKGGARRPPPLTAVPAQQLAPGQPSPPPPSEPPGRSREEAGRGGESSWRGKTREGPSVMTEEK